MIGCYLGFGNWIMVYYWFLAFRQNAREMKAWNRRNITLVWFLYLKKPSATINIVFHFKVDVRLSLTIVSFRIKYDALYMQEASKCSAFPRCCHWFGLSLFAKCMVFGIVMLLLLLWIFFWTLISSNRFQMVSNNFICLNTVKDRNNAKFDHPFSAICQVE